MSYRMNWFRNGRLINTELSQEPTLHLARKRARDLVAEGSADFIEVCRANGEVVSYHLRHESASKTSLGPVCHTAVALFRPSDLALLLKRTRGASGNMEGRTAFRSMKLSNLVVICLRQLKVAQASLFTSGSRSRKPLLVSPGAIVTCIPVHHMPLSPQ